MEKDLRAKSTPVAISPRGDKKADRKKERKANLVSKSADDARTFKDRVVFFDYKDHNGFNMSKYELSQAELDELHKHIPPAAYTFTDEEKKKLVEFRAKVQGWTYDWHGDDYFRRWLIARDWDVQKAAEMFIAAMEWRKKEDIDSILETFPKHRYCRLLTNYWPNILSPIAHTKDGQSIAFEQIGRVDTKIVNFIPLDFFVRWHIYMMEVMEKIRRDRAKEVGWSTGIILIDDLSGFGMGHFYKPALEAISAWGNLDKLYYPEGLRKMYFINSPTMFQMLYKMLKVFYDPRTLSKIEILGTDYEDKLRAIIPEDELLNLYGGKQEFQFPPAGSVKGLMGDEGVNVRHIDVSRSGYHEETITIHEADSVIGWEFSSEDYDISFCCRKAGEPVPKEIEKYNSHKQMIIGFLKVSTPGNYTIRFDNSYSWARGKTVHYRLYVDEDEVPIENCKPSK